MASQESRLIISIDARNAERTAKNLDKELQNITNSGDRADKKMAVLSSSLRSLAGYMAGLVTVSTAISKIDAYSNLQNRLRLVTQSQQELNKATSDTFAIAQKTYQSWDSVVQVYQRFSDNAKTLGINMQKTAALTETVSKAVAISGASTQAAEAALTQFGQALASGVLRGEELNSVMEQTPALAKAIAQGMGITVGQLRSVAAEGKITSDVLVKALGNAASKVDEDFSKMQMTIGQSLTFLDNELTNFASNASGAGQIISSSIKLIAENLELISSGAMVAGIGYVTAAIATKTAAITADVTAMIAQRAATTAQMTQEVALATAATNDARAHLALVQATNASTQAKFGATAAALRYKQATDAVTAAVAQQAAVEKSAQAATLTSARIGSSLLGVLGGPVGIGVTVASIAAGYLLMRNNTEAATQKLEEQAQVASRTTQELQALEGAQRASAKQDLAEAFKAQNEELGRLGRTIANTIAQISSKNTADAETARILREVRQGTLSYEDAFKTLNKTQAASPEIISKLRKEIDSYEEQRQKVQQNADAQKALGVQVALAGNAAQNAVNKHLNNAGAMDVAANSAANLAAKLSGITGNLQAEVFNTKLQAAFEGQGKSAKSASRWVETYTQNAKAGFKGVTIEQKKYLDQLDAEDKKQEARLNAQKAALSATKKASSEAASQAKKDAKEAERLAEEVASIREQITYEYADREKQIEINLQKELADIRKAGMGDGYIDAASKRAYLEKQIYLSQLQYEINEFQMTEKQKLKYKTEINQLMIRADTSMTEENKKIRLKALDEEYKIEVARIELAQQQRINSAREQFLDTTYAMQERYRLERAEIQLINGELERNFRLEMSRLAESTEARKRLMDAQSAWAKTQAQMSGTSEYQGTFDTQNSRMAESQELFDAQMELANSAEERLVIWQAYQERLTQIEQAGAQARRDLNFAYAQSMVGGYTDMFKSMLGEQSTAYKAMFAVQKAFALAQVLLNAPESYSKAYNAMVGIPYIGPVVAPAAGVAAVALQLAQAAQIKSVNLGFKTGGYTGNGGTSDVAGVVHGQEYVLNASATKRVGVDTLNAINSGGSLDTGVNITINNNVNADVMATQNSDGSVTIDIVERKIQESWGRVRNANSNESRVIQQSFGMQPAR